MKLRIALTVLLAGAAVALFILNRRPEPAPPPDPQAEVRTLETLDRQVDDVLQAFGVEKDWVKRKEYVDSAKEFRRIERRVLVPPEIIPAAMNRELNILAHQYQGRAVATENMKENTVTIHLLVDGTIVQTIILKVHPSLRRKVQREQSRKV